jgi:transcriptional regulator with XRE-family HTH domain
MGVIVSMIEERLDQLEERVTWSELAKKLGVNPGTISHFRNDGNELNFKSLLNLSKLLYKNDYIDVMTKWCLNLTLPKNLKCALEFLSSHRRLDELEILMQMIKKEYDSKDLRNWVDLYQILLKHQRNPNDIDYINELRDYAPKSVETKILSSIVEIYYFHRKNDYKTILEKSANLPSCFEMVKDEFIRDSFESRLYEILGYINLYRDSPQTAREYANKIISKNSCAVFAVSSYYIVGMSLIFEDYDKCLYYLKRYEEMLRMYNWAEYIEILHNNVIPFINNIWGKTRSSDEISDILEKAHYEAKYGSKKTAIELLDSSKDKDESPFSLYYRGIAEEDSTILLQSLVKFMKLGNKFLAKLPYELLRGDEKLFKVAELIFNE